MFKVYKQFSYGWKRMAEFKTEREAIVWKLRNNYVREWEKVKIIEG